MGVGIGGDQIRDGGLEEVDLSDTLKNKLIPDPTGITDGYVLTKDEASTGKRKWAAPGGGSADIWRLSPADKPPDSPNSKDDEFTSSETLPGGGSAKWAWSNQGSSTASIQGKRLLVVPQYTSGFNMRVLSQAAPSGAFTITTKHRLASSAHYYKRSGLIILNSSDKGCGFGPFVNPTTHIYWFRINAPNSWNSDGTYGYWYQFHGEFPFAYYRISYDGSDTLTYSFSMDGYNWHVVGTQSVSGFIGTVDKIGICVADENQAATVAAIFEWFRVDWTPDYA